MRICEDILQQAESICCEIFYRPTWQTITTWVLPWKLYLFGLKKKFFFCSERGEGALMLPTLRSLTHTPVFGSDPFCHEWSLSVMLKAQCLALAKDWGLLGTQGRRIDKAGRNDANIFWAFGAKWYYVWFSLLKRQTLKKFEGYGTRAL